MVEASTGRGGVEGCVEAIVNGSGVAAADMDMEALPVDSGVSTALPFKAATAD
jgi:hypothetical protein